MDRLRLIFVHFITMIALLAVLLGATHTIALDNGMGLLPKMGE